MRAANLSDDFPNILEKVILNVLQYRIEERCSDTL